MKVKFTNWKSIVCDSFYNDDEEELEIAVNEGDWYFEVDGKEYYWSVRREEYFDEDGDGKGDGYWVRDMNDNRKVLCDSRWIYWGMDNDRNMDDEVDEKFNDEKSVKDFVIEVSEILEEEDLYIFNNEDIEYEIDRLINKEIEL